MQKNNISYSLHIWLLTVLVSHVSSSRWFSVNQQVVSVNRADSRTLDVSKGLLEEVQHEDI